MEPIVPKVGDKKHRRRKKNYELSKHENGARVICHATAIRL